VRFTGRGYGHGVGMCVIGAGRRAQRGESADAILATYYPGVVIASLDRAILQKTETTTTATAVTAPAIAATVPAARIVARVPAGSAVTAADLEAYAVRARNSLTRVLGTAAVPLTIELYDSLDRFRESTGRPWWVDAAVGDATIDLAPAAVLAQRGGVESAVAEAIARLLVAPALRDRPAWVTVGAARYFTGKTAAATAARLRCPSDAELTLAISAAAQRDAETRAEACFARDYARTGDWRAVR
jgi:hypothetical protein